MQYIKIQDAEQNLKTLIAAALTGEMILIEDEEQRLIQLLPIQTSKKPRQAGSAQGLIHMADDFDAPLVDFDEYMA
jgi:antitoxin (DNA-binding transcriptional repressor) of toxin-antitoxin stability system